MVAEGARAVVQEEPMQVDMVVAVVVALVVEVASVVEANMTPDMGEVVGVEKAVVTGDISLEEGSSLTLIKLHLLANHNTKKIRVNLVRGCI